MELKNGDLITFSTGDLTTHADLRDIEDTAKSEDAKLKLLRNSQIDNETIANKTSEQIKSINDKAKVTMNVLQSRYAELCQERANLKDKISSLADFDFAVEQYEELSDFVAQNDFLFDSAKKLEWKLKQCKVLEDSQTLDDLPGIINDLSELRKSQKKMQKHQFNFSAIYTDDDDEEVLKRKIHLMKSAIDQYETMSMNEKNSVEMSIQTIENLIERASDGQPIMSYI